MREVSAWESFERHLAAKEIWKIIIIPKIFNIIKIQIINQ
jgi:hypothetical protein